MAPLSRLRSTFSNFSITGVDRRAAECIVAEVGVDVALFASSARLASWAGRFPGQHESAGKHKSGRARPGSKWLAATLAQCAEAAGRSKGTYLGAQFQRLRGRRGHTKARKAVEHSILVARPTTCWTATCRIRIWGLTGSCVAAPKHMPAAWPTRSKHSDSVSPSNPPNKPPKPNTQAPQQHPTPRPPPGRFHLPTHVRFRVRSPVTRPLRKYHYQLSFWLSWRYARPSCLSQRRPCSGPSRTTPSADRTASTSSPGNPQGTAMGVDTPYSNVRTGDSSTSAQVSRFHLACPSWWRI